MTRDEALQLARSLVAGALALRGTSDGYCELVRNGRCDDEPAVQAAVAALTIDEVYLAARLKEIRERAESNVVEIAA